MANIVWDSAWDIGHKEIDQQHRKWIDLFNRLESAVLSENSGGLDALQKITLEEMLNYTHFHFEREEKLMKEINYPDAFNHWRLHKDFEIIVYENYRKLKEGGLILNSHLLSLMKNWFIQHIMIEDQKFGHYLMSLSL